MIIFILLVVENNTRPFTGLEAQDDNNSPTWTRKEKYKK